MKLSVRTAVLPAAGLGTRFLPATKTMPKEMLPLVDKPIIQYAVEEAVSAGIEQIVMVTARGKDATIDHFDLDVELETFLDDRGKLDQLAAVRHVSSLARIGAVRQFDFQIAIRVVHVPDESWISQDRRHTTIRRFERQRHVPATMVRLHFA